MIKQTIEGYVEKQFNLGTILQDLEKPLDFLRRMRTQQVKVDVIRKPDTVVGLIVIRIIGRVLIGIVGRVLDSCD